MQGQLFNSAFLTEGITDTPPWVDMDDSKLNDLVEQLRGIFSPFSIQSSLNEAATEDEIIVKVLECLGWTDLLPQQVASGKRREDVPDLLLFPNSKAKSDALKEQRDDRRYRSGIA